MHLKSLFINGGIIIVVIAAIVAGVYAAEKHVNSTAKDAIVTVSSYATGEKVTLDAFDVNILTGRGSIKGLTVPNSSVGSSKTSFVVDKAEIRITPWSILWGPLQFRSIDITNPAVDLETSATSSNLAIILAAAAAYAVTADSSSDKSDKLRVDSLTITGGKLSGKIYPLTTTYSTTLPDIKISDMGGSDGMTQADFVKALLTQVVNQATTAALKH
ncbi:MAG: hypothetical protein CMN56_16205 [Sneathiella sp.]|uniref:hypothetical protein n=1 Tax=Sneathiella sp. TaxID=1964365 RepID=UPI000C3FFB4B|nr:hypothetical protein [Sneathiella sp.]MAZ04676.1 hypothetical protein [Sneathiella sp.]